MEWWSRLHNSQENWGAASCTKDKRMTFSNWWKLSWSRSLFSRRKCEHETFKLQLFQGIVMDGKISQCSAVTLAFRTIFESANIPNRRETHSTVFIFSSLLWQCAELQIAKPFFLEACQNRNSIQMRDDYWILNSLLLREVRYRVFSYNFLCT